MADMGNLHFIIKGLEVGKVPLDKRDQSVKDLAELISSSIEEKDTRTLEKGLSSHSFQYGNFYRDFVYLEWSKFCQKKEFKQISQKTLQLLTTTCSQCPSLGKEVTNEEFKSYNQPSSMGGLNIPSMMLISDYVCNWKDWKEIKINYLSKHQNEIDWKVADNDLLPFRRFSDNILEDEIKKHQKLSDLEIEMSVLSQEESTQIRDKRMSDELIKSRAIANTFHNHVMKNKGSSLFAYTIEIGKQICLANGYIYDSKLSKKETKETHQNRYIYKLLNKEGRNQYISLDTLHGMFEFHNHLGDHLGEYRFNGTLNSPAEPDHNLKSLH